MIAEHPRHVARPLDPPLAIGQGAGANLINGDPLANAGQHIRKLPPPGAVHDHITHRHHRCRRPMRQPRTRIEIGLVAPVIARGHAGEDMAGIGACGLHDLTRDAWLAQASLRQGNQIETRASLQQIRHIEMTLTLLRPSLAKCQKSAQPRIGRTVFGQGHPMQRAVAQHQPRAHDQLGQGTRAGRSELLPRPIGLARAGINGLAGADRNRLLRLRLSLPLHLLERGIGAHHTGQRIAIGNRHRTQAQFRRLRDHLFGVGGPTQEGEIAGDA